MKFLFKTRKKKKKKINPRIINILMGKIRNQVPKNVQHLQWQRHWCCWCQWYLEGRAGVRQGSGCLLSYMGSGTDLVSSKLLNCSHPRYHYLRVLKVLSGKSAGCSEHFRVRVFRMDTDTTRVIPFDYRAGNWPQPCGYQYRPAHLTSSFQIL